MNCSSEIMLDLGVLGRHQCTVQFHYTAGRRATWDDPAVDEDFEITAILLGGVDVFSLVGGEVMHDELVQAVQDVKGDDYSPD